MSAQLLEAVPDTTDIPLAVAIANLRNASNSLVIDPNLSLSRHYWLHIAPPDELAKFIVRQPNHTWNGLTIYPDEVWRYCSNDLWINWRNNQHKKAVRVRKAKKYEPVDWDDDE
ncbi:MAG: hypothetical protein H0X30_30850 [Anaerolineae bacterium]|nr:hypothetical protein [Anaerolineae bacterium]